MKIEDNVNLDRAIKRLDEDKDVLTANKEYIRQHDKYLTTRSKAKDARRKKYYDVLRFWAKIIKKDFKETTKEDIEQAVFLLNENKVLANKGKHQAPFSKMTKEQFKAILKTFYKWLEGDPDEGVYPKKVSWIKPQVVGISRAKPEYLFTEDEIMRLLGAADNPRDRAIISILYSTGCRNAELRGLNIGDVKHESKGIRLFFDGKTGRRACLTAFSVPYIESYLEHHPQKNNPSAPLFVTSEKNRTSRLSAEALRWNLRKVGKRAEITKPLYPHNYRHTRETHVSTKWSDATRCQYFGHKQGSRMVATYTHLEGKNCDDSVLSESGLKKEETESKLTPKKCHICETINASDAERCKKCKYPISLKAMKEDSIQDDERVKELILKSLDVDKLKTEIKEDVLQHLKRKK